MQNTRHCIPWQHRNCYLPPLITRIKLHNRTQAITQNINSQHPISFVNRSLAERGIGRNGNFWQKLRRKRQMNLHYSNTPRRRRRLDARSSDKTIK